MTPLERLQADLTRLGLAGVVVPSTDEFVSEFAPPANRRLAWLTGFRGSMGAAIVLPDAAALFLDSRYLLQGRADAAGLPIEVLPSTPMARAGFLAACTAGAPIGLASALHGHTDMAQWTRTLRDAGLEPVLLEAHPIDVLWRDRPPAYAPEIRPHPLSAAGRTSAEKRADLAAHLERCGSVALLVGDPEDVSWLLNLRAAPEAWRPEPGEWHVVPAAPSRVLLHRDASADWFVDAALVPARTRAVLDSAVRIVAPEALPERVNAVARQGVVSADPRRTSAALILPLEARGAWRADDAVARRRWRKHAAEVLGARRAHIDDAVAVITFMARLKSMARAALPDELGAARLLEALRRDNPAYLGASMPLMSASGANGAMAHHVPLDPAAGKCGARRTLRLGEHPIYWMDSGGQYEGGSTDNTLTLALAPPEPKHVEAHTAVLQALIALTLARFPAGTCGYQLDPLARSMMWRRGLDYGHGTGHGVGACLNIHEGPSISSQPVANALVPLEPDMILSNEPAYYRDGDFGLRLETHMLVVEAGSPGFLAFETLSRLPVDADLVHFGALSAEELHWLARYHATLVEEVGPRLDGATAAWLEKAVRPFLA